MDNHFLFDRIAAYGDRTAMVWKNRAFSYRRLSDGMADWQDRFHGEGIQPGDSVALYGDFSPQIVMGLLASIRNGSIAVPLTPSMASRKAECLKTACVRFLAAFDRNDAFRLRRVTDAADHPLLAQLRSTGDAGLVLFSSGSTGMMKAALHNFRPLLAKLEKKRQPVVTLGFLQFDHIGGINTLLHSLSSGGTLVIGEDRTVPEICRIIEQYRVELLPTTPTFIKMLAMSGLHREYDLSSLKLITYGTEPMPQAILEVASRLFPHVTFKQTYGLTETGILPTKSKDSASLGMKVGQGDCDVKVENGILHVRASTMMMGYLNEFAPIDSDGWYNTGDVVESMEEGYFHILGRESEIINVAGEKVFPGEVENVILKMDNIRDVTVRGAPNPVTGNVVVAEVELAHPEDEDRLEGRVRSHCGDMLPPYMIPVMVTVSSERLYGSRFKKIRRDEMKEGEPGVGSG